VQVLKAKNVILTLGGLGLAGAGYYVYRQFQIAQQVDYDFKNFKIADASANRAVISMDIVIDNKTNLDLKVYSISASAFIDETQVGQALNKTKTLLPKKTVSSVPLSIEIDLGAVGTSLTAIVSNLQTARTAELKILGAMDFGTGIFRVPNYDFDYSENLASLILQNI